MRRTTRRPVDHDVFFMYEDPDRDWCPLHNLDPKTRTKSKALFPKMAATGLCSSAMLGQLVWLPCRPTQFIETAYGKNWIKPSQSRDKLNLVPNGRYSVNEISSVWRRSFERL